MACRKPSTQDPLTRGGAAAVEMAMVAPLIFLLAFSMLELSRGIMVKQSITHAARAACRVAITDNATTQEITDAVNSSLAGTNITPFTVSVTPNPPSDAASGDPVEIQISVQYDDINWLPVPRFMGGIVLQSKCMLPHE